MVTNADVDGAAVGFFDGGFGRAVAAGTAIGFVCTFSVTMFLMWRTGSSLGTSAAVSAFTGFWGGPGFGGMMGATLHSSRRHSWEAAPQDRAHPPSEAHGTQGDAERHAPAA